MTESIRSLLLITVVIQPAEERALQDNYVSTTTCRVWQAMCRVFQAIRSVGRRQHSSPQLSVLRELQKINLMFELKSHAEDEYIVYLH